MSEGKKEWTTESETLKHILRHLTVEFNPVDSPLIFPFNIENFCRENDANIAELKLREWEQAQYHEEFENKAKSLQSQLEECRRDKAEAVKALEFYGDKNNWYPNESFKTSGRIADDDLSYFAGNQTSDLIGGKLARETLAKIKAGK